MFILSPWLEWGFIITKISMYNRSSFAGEAVVGVGSNKTNSGRMLSLMARTAQLA